MIGSNITNIDEVKSINFSGTCGKLIVHEDDIQSPTIKCKRGLFSYQNSGNVEIVSFLDELKIYKTSGSAELLVPRGFKMEEINVSGTSFDIDISDVSIKKINVRATDVKMLLSRLRLEELRSVSTSGIITLKDYDSIKTYLSIVGGYINAEILNYYQNYRMNVSREAKVVIEHGEYENDFNDTFINEFEAHEVGGKVRVLFKGLR